MEEKGHMVDAVRFEELDEIARLVYRELSEFVGEDSFLTVAMADAVKAIHMKTGHPVGTIRSAYGRLVDERLVEKYGERSETRWKIVPLLSTEKGPTETKEPGQLTDDELITVLEERLSELDSALESARERLSEAESNAQHAQEEIGRLEKERPQIVEARDRLSRTVEARKFAIELLGIQ